MDPPRLIARNGRTPGPNNYLQSGRKPQRSLMGIVIYRAGACRENKKGPVQEECRKVDVLRHCASASRRDEKCKIKYDVYDMIISFVDRLSGNLRPLPTDNKLFPPGPGRLPEFMLGDRFGGGPATLWMSFSQKNLPWCSK